MHNTTSADTADIELLSRYIDGDLDIVTVDGLEARLEREPALKAQLATLRRNDVLLRNALHAGPASRIPAAATVSLSQSSNVVALPRRRWLAPFAAAASVLAAVGALLLQSPIDSPSTRGPGMDNLLAAALETTASRSDGWDELDDGSRLRAVLTFPAADGRWCREFLVASDAKHWRGVACRDDNTWVTQVMGSEVFLEQETQYRTASADDDQAVARFIDETATDIALGISEEKALIDSGWQTP